MGYSKYEVVLLNYDGGGKKWFLFDDVDNPIEDANRFLHERYPISLNSQNRVAYSLRYFYEFLDNQKAMMHPSLLTFDDFQEYKKWLRTDEEYRGDEEEHKPNQSNQRTITLRIRDVRIYLMEFIKPTYGLALDLPKERAPRRDDPKSKAVEIDDWRLLMSIASSRNKLLYQFLYESGLRIGELFNVNKEEFLNVSRSGDEEFFCFHVYVAFNDDMRKQPKSQGRPVWIRTALAEKISRYVRTKRYENSKKHHEIFTAEGHGKKADGSCTRLGDPLSYDAVYTALKRDAELAGLDPKKIAPHRARHSFATNLLLDGASETEVKTQMGHASIATISIYSQGLTLKVGKTALESARSVGAFLDGSDESDKKTMLGLKTENENLKAEVARLQEENERLKSHES